MTPRVDKSPIIARWVEAVKRLHSKLNPHAPVSFAADDGIAGLTVSKVAHLGLQCHRSRSSSALRRRQVDYDPNAVGD